MTNIYYYAKKSEFREIVENQKLRLYSSSSARYRENWGYGFEFAKEYLLNHKLSKISPLIDGTLSHIDIATAKASLDNVPCYAISFFADYSNNDLWKKYAENGEGVVIEFDVDVLLDFIYKNREVEFPEQFSEEPDIRMTNVHYGYNEEFLAKVMAKTIEDCNGIKTQALCFLESMGGLLNGSFLDDSLFSQKETRLIFRDWLPAMKRSEILGNDEKISLRAFEIKELVERKKAIGLSEEKSSNDGRFITLDISSILGKGLIKCIYADGKISATEARKVLDSEGLKSVNVTIIDIKNN